MSSDRERVETNKPELISIKNLSSYTFKIPVYQRGFRWRRQQIKELIDDLYKCKDGSYCLQNITVTSALDGDGNSIENCYEVIDGQQRLTAFWILMVAAIELNPDDFKEAEIKKFPLYDLQYNEKEKLTNYVKRIKETIRTDNKIKDIDMDIPEDIDSMYIYDAFKYLIYDEKEGALYNNDGTSAKIVLREIFVNVFIKEKTKSDITFIWNPIVAKGQNDNQKINYIINKFSNINDGKIPLTESELIKAYFINGLAKEDEAEFALQWEEIERGLNDEELWGFISSKENNETRIDMLFEVYFSNKIKSLSGEHILSRLLADELKPSQKKLEEAEDDIRCYKDEKGCEDELKEAEQELKCAQDEILNKWKEIVKIYHTISDWYKDYYFYHTIGLIISVEEDEASYTISQLYGEYKSRSKLEFKEYLKDTIRKENCFRILNPNGIENNSNWIIKDKNSVRLDDSGDYEISYDNNNKKYIKPILLLFNVALLINAYNVCPENALEKISFRIYKKKHNNKDDTEIEHINPQHLEDDSDRGKIYGDVEKLEWAEKTLDIIVNTEVRNNYKKEIDNCKNNGSKIKDKTIIDGIEAAANLHNISNLTLLDYEINSTYKDKCYGEKRKEILNARFGNPVKYNKKEKTFQSVIFPGTMWVFARLFNLEGKDKHGEDSNANKVIEVWGAQEKKKYIECMQESICNFLKNSD